MKHVIYIIPAAAMFLSSLLGSCCGSVPPGRQYARLVVGTYTERGGEGIYVYDFDTVSGESCLVDSAAASNPSFLAFRAGGGGGFIYAVREDNLDSDALAAFSVDAADGEMRFLNEAFTDGRAPCYVVAGESHAVTANYTGGSISVFGLNGDGTLSGLEQLISFEGHGTVAGRQDSPHLHCTIFSPDGRYLFATDLGTDRIYRFDVRRAGANPDRAAAEPFLAEATRRDFTLPPGSGPRHMVFNPAGTMMYIITELGGGVLAYRYAEGELTHVQTIQADPVRAGGSADIVMTPDGRFLYASNRLHGDGVAIFRAGDDGLLSAAGYQSTGAHPRNIAVSPGGAFLLVASRDEDRIEVYAIDPATGALSDTGKAIAVGMPVCLLFTE